MLTEDQIKEFQQIYKNQFNKEISKEEALRQGTKLITLMKILVDNHINNQCKTQQKEISQIVKKIKVSIDDKTYEYQVEEKDLKVLLKVIEAFSK